MYGEVSRIEPATFYIANCFLQKVLHSYQSHLIEFFLMLHVVGWDRDQTWLIP